MSKIIIRFASHTGIFNGLCRFAQYGFWATHSEAVLPDSQRIGSWYHKGGVRIEPPDYDTGTIKQELFIGLKATDAQAEAFYVFLHSQIGKPYDALAIASFVSGRDWQQPDSWSCSELIGAGLAACGLFPQHMAVKFSKVTPRDALLLASMVTESG